MKLPRRQFLHLAAGAATLPVSRVAWAQAYPSRPITMMVPFPPGGLTDVVGRLIAEGMRTPLGQTIIIENVGGATGSIGTGRVARAAPDGYTITVGIWNTHVANGITYALQYDVVSDFEPIALLADAPLLFLGKKDLPANSLKELIGWLKENPDKASMGSTGMGGPGHLLALLLQEKTGTRFNLVPYRGVNPSVQDLIAGQIDMTISNTATAIPHIRAARVKAFAVTTKDRIAIAPENPVGGGSGVPLVPVLAVGGSVRPEGHAEGHHRQAQRRRRWHNSRSRHAPKPCRPGLCHSVARAPDPGSARRLPESRDRQMVADYQGGWHQGGVSKLLQRSSLVPYQGVLIFRLEAREPPAVKRRQFITLLGGAAASWPLGARAQQKLPTIGFLGADASAFAPWTAAFVARLHELGWIEGQTVAIEYRWSQGRTERYAEIAAEFVSRSVDAIVTVGSAVPTVRHATATIPIVFAVAIDPVGSGLVASLAKPGGNVTGLSLQATNLAGKRLELLREVVPQLHRLAIIFNVGNAQPVLEMGETQAAARMLGLDVAPLVIQRAEDIAPAFEGVKTRADALYVAIDQPHGCQPHAHSHIGAWGRAADGLQHPRFCSRRRFHVLRAKLLGYVPALGGLRGQDIARNEARRHTGRAADEI